MGILAGSRSERRATVFSSHHGEDVAALADDVAFVHGGEIIAHAEVARFLDGGRTLESHFLERVSQRAGGRAA